jgi:hypothetical protein
MIMTNYRSNKPLDVRVLTESNLGADYSTKQTGKGKVLSGKH